MGRMSKKEMLEEAQMKILDLQSLTLLIIS